MLPTITASFGERGGNLNPESNHDTEKAMRVAIPKLMALLPTPTAMMDEAPIEKVDARNQKQIEKGNSPFILGLGQQAMRGMLPTPNARDWKDTIGNGKDAPSIGVTRGYSLGQKINSFLPTPNAAEGYKSAKTYNPSSQMGSSLSAMAGSGMLPTPTVADSKHSTTKSDSWDKRIDQKHLAETVLNPFIEKKGGKTSQLNPRFVAEMMGFPPNWTELPFLNGEQNQLKDTETP